MTNAAANTTVTITPILTPINVPLSVAAARLFPWSGVAIDGSSGDVTSGPVAEPPDGVSGVEDAEGISLLLQGGHCWVVPLAARVTLAGGLL